MSRFSNGLISILFITLTIGGGVLTIFVRPTTARADTVGDAQAQKAVLESQLAELEAEIAAKQKELDSQKGQSASLSRDITVLSTQINKAKLDIKARTLTITKLSGEITEKNTAIQSLETQIGNSKSSLSQIIRKTNEIDNLSIVHVVLSSSTLSNIYGDVDSFASLKRSMKSSLDSIIADKTETETQKNDLQEKQNQELDAKAAIEAAKHKVELSESEKQKLLTDSKNKEKSYQVILADRQKTAAQIRARLFQLAGGAAPISFADAVKFAQQAEAKTGVRTAFTLAIAKQETGIGKVTGRCYLTSTTTAAGIRVTDGKVFPTVMKPSRDLVPFLVITSELGLDPLKTFVSCPQSVDTNGGALGIAQFIPSTWNLLKSKIAAAVGVAIPNPWEPRDGLTASAIYLADLGAAAKTYSAEIKAACKYYGSGGTTCSYGRSVMAIAQDLQDDIDYVNTYGTSPI